MVMRCQRVSLRFMGLWDTVRGTDRGSGRPASLAPVVANPVVHDR